MCCKRFAKRTDLEHEKMNWQKGSWWASVGSEAALWLCCAAGWGTGSFLQCFSIRKMFSLKEWSQYWNRPLTELVELLSLEMSKCRSGTEGNDLAGMMLRDWWLDLDDLRGLFQPLWFCDSLLWSELGKGGSFKHFIKFFKKNRWPVGPLTKWIHLPL